MENVNEELDSDLTMLNKEQAPSPFDALFDGAKFESAMPTEALPEEVQAEATAQFSEQEALFADATSEEPDAELDAYKSRNEDTNSVRARNQSEAVKGVKAIGSGLLNGVLITAEQLGYVADIDTYTNMYKSTKDFEGNWFTRYLKETQENISESEAFKIYEENPDENSALSQIFKWSSLQGAIQSSVGFGLAGLGSVSLVSKLGSLGKFAQMGKYADEVLGVAGGATAAFTGPLATSAISNFYMGQMMATDTYKATMDQFKTQGLIGSEEGQMTELDAQKLAAGEAQDVVELNMALVATGYLTFGNWFKRGPKLNTLLKDPTYGNKILDLVKKGSATAFASNVYQEMIQMEQIHDATVEAGGESIQSEDFLDRAAQLALSNRAVHAGALGVVGGPIQFALIQAPMMGKQMAAERTAYKGQQDQMKWQAEVKNWRKSVVDGNTNEFAAYDELYRGAVDSGNLKHASIISDLGVVPELVKSVTWGTIDYLKKDIGDIMKMSPEEADAAGYDAQTYAEEGQRFLDLIGKTEQIHNTHSKMSTVADIVQNRVGRDILNSKSFGLQIENITTQSAIVEKIKLNPKLASVTLDSDLNIVRAEDRFENLDAKAKAALKNKEAVEDRVLEKALGRIDESATYKDNQDIIKKLDKLIDSFDSKYTHLMKPSTQKAFAERQAAAIKDSKQNMATENRTTVEENGNKAKSKLTPFEDIRKEAPIRTAEEKKEFEDAHKDNIDNTTKSVIKQGTFTSFDQEGVQRVYTPGDLVMSKDGRTWRVVGQNYASQMKGNLKASTMPIIEEVTEKGKSNAYKTKGGKVTVLTDNNWLREEVRQSTSAGYYMEKWAKYVESDTILRPAYAAHEFTRVEKAAEGIAQTVNDFEYEANSAEDHIRKREMDEYALQDLNVPFSAPYEVELKIRKGGTGETVVDVYRTSDGVLLTRLDRHYNLNHKAITDALVNGPVKGKITEHFSSGKNIMHKLDEAGDRVYSPLSEVLNMPKHHLPNGRLIIAQTKGENAYDSLDIAADDQGRVYTEGIEIERADGSIITQPIPYSKMRAGDAYILMVAPSGNIVPITTSGKQIHETSGAVDKVVAGINASIAEVFKDTLENQIELDDKATKSAEASNTSVSMQNRLKHQYKFDEIIDKSEAFKKSLEDTAYTTFRPNNSPYYARIAKYDGESIYELDARGRKLIKEGYFEVLASLDSNGNIVAAVKVRDDSRPYESKDKKHKGTKTYNITDNAEQFYEIIGGRRRKMSIVELSKATAANNVVEALMTGNELLTDVNIAQPFGGSSATVQLEGPDVLSASSKAADVASTLISKSYGKDFDNTAKELIDKNAEESKEIFLEEIDAILEGTNEGLKVTELAELGSLEDISDGFADMVSILNLPVQAVSAMVKFVSTPKESLSSEDRAAVEAKIVELKENGLDKYVEEIAKGLVQMNTIKEQVLKGKLKLRRRAGTSVKEGKFKQPEGYVFGKGSNIYHPQYKEAVVKGVSPDGMYNIVSSDGKKAKVYPADTFASSGDYTKLYKERIRIAKLKEGSPAHNISQRKIARLEARIEYLKAKEAGTLVDTGVSADADAGTSYAARIEAMRELSVMIPDNYADVIIEKAEGNKTEDISRALAKLEEALVEMSEADANMETSADIITKSRALLKQAIPYTTKYFDKLITLAEESIATSPDNKAYYEGVLTDLKKAQKLSEEIAKAEDTGDLVTVNFKPFSRGQAIIPGVNQAVFENSDSLQVIAKTFVRAIAAEVVLQQSKFSKDAPRDAKDIAAVIQPDATPIKPNTKVKLRGSGIIKAEILDFAKSWTTTSEESISNFIDKIKSKVEEFSTAILEENKNFANDEVKAEQALSSTLEVVNSVIATLETDKSKLLEGDLEYHAEVLALKANLEDSLMQIQKGSKETHTKDKKPKGKSKRKGKKNKKSTTGDVTLDSIIELGSLLADGPLLDRTVWEDFAKIAGKIPTEELTDLVNTLKTLSAMGVPVESTLQEHITKHTPEFKLGEEAVLTPEQFNKEVAEVRKLLPQIPLEIVQNVTSMVNRFGHKALGAWDRGTRIVVRNAEAGTAYHETFHAVAELYLSPAEKQKIAEELGFEKFDLSANEAAAERFEAYSTQFKKAGGIVGLAKDALSKFFDTILTWVGKSRPISTTDKVFEKIMTGGFAYAETSSIRDFYSKGLVLKDVQSKLTHKNRVLLQELIDTKKIKIVC